MKYNLFIETYLNTYNLLDIDDKELNKIIESYNLGKENFFLKGKKRSIRSLKEIQIYTFEHDVLKNEEDIFQACRKEDLYGSDLLMNYFVPKSFLNNCGERVTDSFIFEDFGHGKISDGNIPKDLFVDEERIKQLERIENTHWDLLKLNKFLEELNIAYTSKCFLTVPLIIRAIIDHVPPIFKKNNFNEVSGSYGSRSFRDSMTHLNKSSRKIADSLLHSHIREKEILPNKTQINFRQDLDVLLQEIVRLHK